MTEITEQHFPMYHIMLPKEHLKADLKFERKPFPSYERRFITLVTDQKEIWRSQRKTTAEDTREGTVTTDTKYITER